MEQSIHHRVQGHAQLVTQRQGGDHRQHVRHEQDIGSELFPFLNHAGAPCPIPAIRTSE